MCPSDVEGQVDQPGRTILLCLLAHLTNLHQNAEPGLELENASWCHCTVCANKNTKQAPMIETSTQSNYLENFEHLFTRQVANTNSDRLSKSQYGIEQGMPLI